jgi:PAS domain S-box-containing protein
MVTRAESRSSTSANLLEAVIERSLDGLMVIDPEGFVRFANPAARALFAGRTSELVGFHVGTPALREPGEILLPGGGEIRHVEVRCCEISWDGRTATLASLRDVTAHARVEETLRESERLHRLLADNTLDVIWALDAQVQVTYVNPAITPMLGYSPAELVGTRLEDHFDAASYAEVAEVIARTAAEGPDAPGVTVETEVLRKDGSRVPLEIHGRAVFDGSGTLTGFQGTARDVTERRRAIAEREWLVASMENTAESIFITDTAGLIVYVNPAFERRTGYTREEAIGATPRMLKSGEHDAAFYATLWQTLGEGSTWQGRLVNLRKDGTRFTEEGSISPVRDRDGRRVVNYVSVMRDITARLELEEQVRQAQKMESIGRLAGGVAHDFNNMLSVILGNADLALEGLDPSHPAHDKIREILKAGERSAALTRQLLAFARKQTIAPRVLDLNDTIAGMMKMLRRLIGEGVQMVWKPAAALWPVSMDPGQIDQILVNLLVNARDAVDGAGEVTLQTGNRTVGAGDPSHRAGVPPGPYVLLAVSDNGAGMEESTLSKIFEPFFTTKDSSEGTGLGLATVYGIVKQNEGHIEVSSEPGRGTTFRIYLPRVADAQPDSRDAPGVAKPPTGTETVLLVEDEAPLLKLSTRVLERLGYRVLSASDPAEAIRLAREHTGPIHLLLTDVVMPGMSGWDLWRRLADLPGLKCVFISGYTDNVIARRGVLDPGVHFLQKPFDAHTLAVKLREALAG